MHLRSLTLKGFKSFPDRTRLEFSPGVSVIVGPNGSGKSNVTDAVLWVMGEQSPLAVRGASMQDVIFAGAHGVQARSEAEVEVVLDNGDGVVDLPLSELSIVRRLNRAGDGEYRINGARCRLTDVIEILSDTGLGKEMHSVVSQGRVESIVTSKPRDRRMLIEEAAGLGKHRKRRRRAQLKLDRTHDNLDRSLDVEREARTRLRPLKRQAEAAELHERLERQTDEARWSLARDALRTARGELEGAEAAVAEAREASARTEAALDEVRGRRERAEEALSARGSEREGLSNRFYAARSAAERIGLRLESAGQAATGVGDRIERRRALLASLEAEAAQDTGDDGAAERIAGLETELAQLAEDRQARLEQEIAELEERRGAAAAESERLAGEAETAVAARREVDAAAESSRKARRETEAGAEKARREAARVGAELAAVNQFLRSHAGAPGGSAALADALGAEPGYELALAAALGPRLRAAVAADLSEGASLLDRAGRDGAAALVMTDAGPDGAAPAPPSPSAEPLLSHVRAPGDDPGARLARALLADAWVVDDLAGLARDFNGIAVTRSGRVWSPSTRELRQVPAGGEDRLLAERNRRDALVAEVGRTAEAERHVGFLIVRRRAAPDEGESAERRTQVESALATERRLAERAEREREQRTRRIAAERDRLGLDEALGPAAERLAAALEAARDAVAERVTALEAELRADRHAGEQLAAELRTCAAEESRVQAQLKERGEAVTRGEVRAQRLRDQAADAEAELTAVATKLGLEAEPASEALSDEEREGLEGRILRLNRRREQLGPVNPLAQQEYAEAVAHVEDLERQREDLEAAMRELEGLIRDTDKRIREAFEETFAAAARNFEEVAEHLFPGGRGRLRLVREDSGPRPVLGGGEGDEAEDAPSPEDRVEEAVEDVEAEAAAAPPEDAMGVEIEITPAGKATKRLMLLSGGEKSLTALAFLFAVFLAKPCPFYILDEVEAALDDINIDRFLTLLGRFSDRAQFIVVTHQKRTMEAADCLYGVSMAGNGVSKVVSRRLPARSAAA